MSKEEYNMNKRRRGLALIFNHQTFDFNLNLPSRFGSDVDCDKMQESLKGLGFEVKVFIDLRKTDVEKEIDEAAKADHSDADCFVLVYMSHGEDDYVHTYDDKLDMKDITDKFKGTECKSLLRKPKIFIWQACCKQQQEQPCDGIDTEDDVVNTASVNTLPAGADFIMCYAVAKGYYSIRNTEKGSWFIQDLCELLQKYGKSLEFTKLLTLVNRKVSKREGVISTDQRNIETKQVPCFVSMLTKKLFFRPKQ